MFYLAEFSVTETFIMLITDEYIMCMEKCWNDTDSEKSQSTRRKTCSSITLSTTNPIQIGLGLNQGPCGYRSANNHLTLV
jgi:hypothetical protein